MSSIKPRASDVFVKSVYGKSDSLYILKNFDVAALARFRAYYQLGEHNNRTFRGANPYRAINFTILQ